MSEIAFLFTLSLILLTLFVVLLERKFLAYAQRRMGPAIMGRNGYFQIILDLLKLITKETFILPRMAATPAPTLLMLLYSSQLFFAHTFIWGPNIYLFTSLDSLIIFYLILVLVSNFLFLLVGLISQSKYAILGSIRSFVHILSLDIFITLLYSFLVFTSQSPNFHEFVLVQNGIWLFFLLSPAMFAFLTVLILESKRAPFDHAETESEVVAGYAVEYSGTMLLIFYLCEYTHLIIGAVAFVLFFGGGWSSYTILNLTCLYTLP